MRKFAGIAMIEFSTADVLRQLLVSHVHAWDAAPKDP